MSRQDNPAPAAETESSPTVSPVETAWENVFSGIKAFLARVHKEEQSVDGISAARNAHNMQRRYLEGDIQPFLTVGRVIDKVKYPYAVCVGSYPDGRPKRHKIVKFRLRITPHLVYRSCWSCNSGEKTAKTLVYLFEHETLRYLKVYDPLKKGGGLLFDINDLEKLLGYARPGRYTRKNFRKEIKHIGFPQGCMFKMPERDSFEDDKSPEHAQDYTRRGVCAIGLRTLRKLLKNAKRAPGIKSRTGHRGLCCPAGRTTAEQKQDLLLTASDISRWIEDEVLPTIEAIREQDPLTDATARLQCHDALYKALHLTAKNE